jgi:hypothetical protein
VKRVIYLASVALLAVMLLAPVAVAQEDTGMMEGTGTMGAETTGVGAGTSESGLPSSGGVSIVLPAAALLLGSGVLAYAVVRRR